jgi:hypothetical protein
MPCYLKDKVVKPYTYETVHYVHLISTEYPYFSVSCSLSSHYSNLIYALFNPNSLMCITKQYSIHILK